MKVLDKGYLRFVEVWGSDERIIEAARMSTAKGFLGWDPRPCDCVTGCHLCDYTGELKGDARLLSYLYTNKHATPFEMAGLVIEVEAPIMVFREWHRHRTQSYNEMSARYVPLPDNNYMPTPERCLLVQGKQGGGSEGLTHEDALRWLESLEQVYTHCEQVYQAGLAVGIPKELARLCVPVGRYSRMRASANLRNWLAFLTLRMDRKAQYEIRQYAYAVGDIIRDYFPRTWRLFCESSTLTR